MAPIHAAACDANVGALRRILAEGVLPDAIDVTFEGTPLHALCKSEWAAGDRVACFKLLRDAGANLEARQFISNFTPLHYSALRTNVELVSLLIQAGVNLNARAHDGSTPLHMVAHLRNARAIDCCELLLKAGAAVNLKTHEYSTPLDVALMRGNRRIVPVFLRAGAEFRYSNLNAYTLRVRDAGGLTRYEQPHLGFKKYAQNHLARITEILAPTPLLPPELVRKILEFWLHAGYYCYY